MLKTLSLLAAAILLPSPITPVGARAQSLPLVRFGVIIDGEWSRNDEIFAMFRKEIFDLTTGEFDVRFPEAKTIIGDWTAATAHDAVDRMLTDDEVDFVLTLGVLSSHDICHRAQLSKPAIAPIVIDADLQEMPQENGKSGVRNLNYIVFPKNIQRDVKAFLDITHFETLAFVMAQHVHDAIPNSSSKFKEIVAELGVKGEIIPVGSTVQPVLDRLDSGIDAAYVAPLIQLPPAEFRKLVDGLIERKIPSFSLMGKSEVEAGLFAGLNADIFPRLTRRVALNVQRILLGEKPEDLQTTFPSEEQLTINIGTARAIGVFPSWGVLTEAVVIGERRTSVDRVLTLETATREAITVNLQLAVRNKAVAAAREDIALATAKLLPQLDLNMLGLQIDKDRAERSLGTQSERTLSGSVTLSQVLYSDPAWANRTIQKRLQRAREFDRDAFELDIAQQAATAYLNVLRAYTFETIQQENLRRTRSNLELARVRESIGTARPAEVLRWESQIAKNRQAVIDANSQRNLTEIQLNRLLQHPAEEPFLTEEVNLNDPELLLSGGRLLDYMSNPWDFKQLRAFMVQEGLNSTPELRSLREAISAQERVLSAAGRSFWLPSFVLFGDVDYVFLRDGAGSEVPGGLPPDLFTAPEDLSWDLGVSLDYPIFSGGARVADRRQAAMTLEQLRLDLNSTADIVEQRIRSAFHVMGASYAAIEQSRLAADAAEETLDLVEEAYSLGGATILDLLDAQNNALVAGEAEANATYDFLIDLMEAERSVGLLVLQMSERERSDFFDRIDRFFGDGGGQNDQ